MVQLLKLELEQLLKLELEHLQQLVSPLHEYH